MYSWRQYDMSADLSMHTVVPDLSVISRTFSLTHENKDTSTVQLTLTHMDTYSLSVSLFLCECARWSMPRFPESQGSLRQHVGAGTSGFQGRQRGCRDEAKQRNVEQKRQHETRRDGMGSKKERSRRDDETVRDNQRRSEMRLDKMTVRWHVWSAN